MTQKTCMIFCVAVEQFLKDWEHRHQCTGPTKRVKYEKEILGRQHIVRLHAFQTRRKFQYLQYSRDFSTLDTHFVRKVCVSWRLVNENLCEKRRREERREIMKTREREREREKERERCADVKMCMSGYGQM